MRQAGADALALALALALLGGAACSPPPSIVRAVARLPDVEPETRHPESETPDPLLADVGVDPGRADRRPGTERGDARAQSTVEAHWCADDGWVALNEATCVFAPVPRPSRLVFFAHGMLAPNQSPALQQRIVRQAARALRFVAVFPRGRAGLCSWSRSYDEWLCWPTTAATFEHEAPAILDRWAQVETAIENVLDVRFAKRFLVGFSNGGYFAAYVATSGLSPFDGVAVLGAGRGDFDDRPMAAAGAPLSIIVGELEARSTREAAERLAAELERRDWPHEIWHVPRRGHRLVVEDFERSFRAWEPR